MEHSGGITPVRRLFSIFTGSVGNPVEWCDRYVYSSFAIYFAAALAVAVFDRRGG